MILVILDNQNTKNEVTKICNEQGINQEIIKEIASMIKFPIFLWYDFTIEWNILWSSFLAYFKEIYSKMVM